MAADQTPTQHRPVRSGRDRRNSAERREGERRLVVLEVAVERRSGHERRRDDLRRQGERRSVKERRGRSGTQMPSAVDPGAATVTIGDGDTGVGKPMAAKRRSQ